MKKKYLSSALAMLAAASMLAVYATASEKKYSPDDLRSLSYYLHGSTENAVGQDVNNDGKVNIFDLVTMRKNLAINEEFAESEVKVTDNYVKYIGRNYYDNDTLWLVHSGSAVEFTVTAKSASVTLAGDGSINSDPDYRSRYAVIVDGEIIVDSTMSEKTKTIELFTGDVVRTSKVKVIHLSEANNGAVGVSSINVVSNLPSPVVPTPEKDLCIEFIGDSITCAYGVEGASNYESFKTTTENFMKSYAYLVADKLDADYSAVCYSGHGIISGYTSTGEKNEDSLVPAYYENIGSWENYAHPWDFSARQNDVVVINLGTNDNTYVDKDIDVRGDEFAEGYTEFLKTVRKNNPDAYIICTLGTMGCNQLYPYIEKAIEDFKTETGDERISSYESVTQVQSDGYGSDWHPSPVTQQKSAYVLADKICKALGIESDEIGLDMAAEAVYSLNKNEDNGANAWPYFSDFDRSYNVNVTSGGSEPADLEAVASPIKIVKGGKYRITFTCSGANVDMPVLIRSKNGEEYFGGTLKASGTDPAFNEEFTSDVTDENAEFVIQLGGDGSKNITIRNLRIEKIG